ncbi:MAG: putative manganese-dependent inorganic diphosphatase [Peptococcaceae bacterium]|jgi:manganese-dependent inorganic pyrophosphatase|nr:putative manganese-dependent inorganic diphosphatase [Peptococcaceae bacterium]
MDKQKIYVLGHKNPDTDSICAAISYAELKKRRGFNAVAGRLGELNRETAFVLNYFGVAAPELVETVKKQVSDLSIDVTPSISPEIPVKTTWTIMKNSNVKSLPVVDENEKLVGVVTLSNITEKYMDVLDNRIIAASKTTLQNIAETIHAEIISGSSEDFHTTGQVMILAADPQQMADFVEKGDIIISGNRQESVIPAIEIGANCVILTCCHEADQSIIDRAEEFDCILMTTEADTFTTARLINQSIPIGYVMSTENIVKFDMDDFVDEVRETMMKTRFRSYPVVDGSNRVLGFISRYHVISQHKKQVILVDHNEMSQTAPGIEEAEILEIIDHHRLGDLQTNSPMLFNNEPVGSTCTIIANMYFNSGIRPPAKIAGLMCSAILSDTLRFQSPTCTYLDRITAEKLAEIADIQIDAYAMSMFKAGSSLKGRSPRDILNEDFKVFELHRGKIGISQVYTIDMESIIEIEEPMIQEMLAYCTDGQFDLLLLLVTDVLNQGSELFFAGEMKEVIGRAFNVQPLEYRVFLPGVVSRKKQVLPGIVNALETIG